MRLEKTQFHFYTLFKNYLFTELLICNALNCDYRCEIAFGPNLELQAYCVCPVRYYLVRVDSGQRCDCKYTALK